MIWSVRGSTRPGTPPMIAGSTTTPTLLLTVAYPFRGSEIGALHGADLRISDQRRPRPDIAKVTFELGPLDDVALDELRTAMVVRWGSPYKHGSDAWSWRTRNRTVTLEIDGEVAIRAR